MRGKPSPRTRRRTGTRDAAPSPSGKAGCCSGCCCRCTPDGPASSPGWLLLPPSAVSGRDCCCCWLNPGASREAGCGRDASVLNAAARLANYLLHLEGPQSSQAGCQPERRGAKQRLRAPTGQEGMRMRESHAKMQTLETLETPALKLRLHRVSGKHSAAPYCRPTAAVMNTGGSGGASGRLRRGHFSTTQSQTNKARQCTSEGHPTDAEQRGQFSAKERTRTCVCYHATP